MSERTRIDRLIEDVLACAPEERDAFLDAACEGNVALRSEIASLLEQASRANSFLEQPAAVPSLVGRTLGPYRIDVPIGAGGMGEVYRARDTKLGRDVAIKILPAFLAQDPDRLARLGREARTLAALNHPHIGSIYGIEEADGVRGLVLELVDGETLADRIAKGPLAIGEALRIAGQIAEALAAAHAKGIVHRDLKPANIKITTSGSVKVLDFGLAKAEGEESEATTLATRLGTVMGTPAYMSPEQARGEAVDQQTDIWAFGCVLYEMLTARRAFDGRTASDLIAAVLKAEPDWSSLPSEVPLDLRKLLSRCLAKDRMRRLHSVADLRIELDDLARASHEISVAPRGHGRLPSDSTGDAAGWRKWALVSAVTVATALSAGLGFMILNRTRAVDPTPSRARLTVTLPASAPLIGGLAISPDGTRLVYVGSGPSVSARRLYVRAFDSFEPRALEGSEGASEPFFSPDGLNVAFFAGGKLKKMPALGGEVVAICDVPDDTGGSGGAWGPDGTIVFAGPFAARTGLQVVPASGGPPRILTRPDPNVGGGHAHPSFVGDTRWVLFATPRVKAGVRPSLMAASLDTGETRQVADGGRASYAGGQLLYTSGTGLMAMGFDPLTLKGTGEPWRVIDDVLSYATSATGRLIYQPRRQVGGPLVWVDRTTKAESPLLDDGQSFGRPRVSPDGSRLVLEIIRGFRTDIGIYRLDTRTMTPLTENGASNSPYWTPDGRRVVFRTGGDLFWRAVDTTAPAEMLLSSTDVALKETSSLAPGMFDPNRTFFAFVVHATAGTAADIWKLQLSPERRVEPLVQRTGNQWGVRVSPDARWISYASNESGRFEMNVQELSGNKQRYQVSNDGGREGVWSPTGRELFYRSGDRMLAVPITPRAAYPFGAPRVVFSGQYDSTDIPDYDVTRDGNRFVMVKAVRDEADTRTIRVIDNWFDRRLLK